MKEQDVLYFEEDDTSELGANGKQVFVAKRINGKTSRNKSSQEDWNFSYKEFNNKTNINKNDIGILDEEDFIGLEKNKTSQNKSKKDVNKKENKAKETNDKEKRQSKNKTKSKSQKQKNSQPNNKGQKKIQNKSENQTKSQEKKQSQNYIKKQKKRKKRIRIFIILVLIIGAGIFALVSPTFNIVDIIVEGNETISSSTIISLSGLEKEKNIFQNLKSQIAENIKENQYIENVEIHRELPGTMKIIVEERKVAYQIKVIDGYVYIDYQGYILETSSEKANVPTIEGFETSQEELLSEKRVLNSDIKRLNKILKILKSMENIEAKDLISNIKISEYNEYVLYLENEKKYVYLGDATDLTNKMLYLKIILEQEKEKTGKIMLDGKLNEGFKPRFTEQIDDNNIQTNDIPVNDTNAQGAENSIQTNDTNVQGTENSIQTNDINVQGNENSIQTNDNNVQGNEIQTNDNNVQVNENNVQTN